jgi:hypothetical protein
MIKNTSEEATFLMTHSWDGPGLSCLVGKRPWGAGLRKTRIKVPQIKALRRLRRNDCSHGISSFPGKRHQSHERKGILTTYWRVARPFAHFAKGWGAGWEHGTDGTFPLLPYAAPLTSAMPQLGLSPATLLLRIFASHGIFKHPHTKGRPIWRITTTNR